MRSKHLALHQSQPFILLQRPEGWQLPALWLHVANWQVIDTEKPETLPKAAEDKLRAAVDNAETSDQLWRIESALKGDHPPHGKPGNMGRGSFRC